MVLWSSDGRATEDCDVVSSGGSIV